MNTRARWFVVASTAAALTAVAAFAPAVLRRVDAFAVQQVEIRGTRYLEPYEVLAQSGITRESNIFDEFTPWRTRLRQHPLVLDVKIERKLPGTLKIFVTESEPLALARTPELRPVDARARALPIDPGRMAIDVPVLGVHSSPNGAGVFTDTTTRTLLAVLNTIERADPRLYAWVSEATTMTQHAVRLRLRTPLGAQALVPADAQALRLPELNLVLADLAARDELPRLQTIDARFRDQIVVRVASQSENGN